MSDVPRPTFTPPPVGDRSRKLEERDPLEITNPGLPVFPSYVKEKLDRLGAQFEATLARHDNKLTWRSVGVAVGAVAASVIAGIIFIDNRVHAETDAGVKVHEQRIVTLEQEVPQLRQEVYESRKENRADLKALQDALLTRHPSARLEEPVPTPVVLDGGHK